MDRRILRTRVALKDAFIQLLKTQSFDEITVQQIADRANVNRATFYKHYEDKHHLLAVLEEAIIEKVRQLMEASTPVSGQALLQSQPAYDTIVEMYEYMEQERELMVVLLRSNEQATIMTHMQYLFEQMLLRHFKQMSVHKQAMPLEFVVVYLAAAHIGVLRHWLLTKTGHTPEQMAMMLMKILRDGPVLAMTTPLQES